MSLVTTILFLAGRGQASQQVDTAFIATLLELFFKDAAAELRNHAAFNLVRSLDCLRRQENATWTH
jgi:hypothetical protein